MKIFLALFISLSLFANDEVETQTALESLVFKAGITSLINDFEREKNITRQNRDDIEELKQNVKFLMAQSLKNKFSSDSDVQSIPTNNNQIELLMKENQKLKEYIKQLETKKKKVSVSSNSAKIVHEKASIKSAPFQSSTRTRFVYFGDIVEIKSCNKYDWCKLANKEEYIPKYKIRFLK